MRSKLAEFVSILQLMIADSLKPKNLIIKSFELVAIMLVTFISLVGLIGGYAAYDSIYLKLFEGCCAELYSLTHIVLRAIFSLITGLFAFYISGIAVVFLAIYLFRLSSQEIVKAMYPDEDYLEQLTLHKDNGLFWRFMNSPIVFVEKWYQRLGS